MIDKNCLQCGIPFKTYPYMIKRGNGKYCGKKCQFESMRKTIILSCKQCNKEFRTIPCEIKLWNRQFCSPECSYKSRIGHKVSEEVRKRIGDAHTGEKSYSWKGDNVGYIALHEWVYKQLGSPQICEFCGIKSEKLQWANKSHFYKRDVTDWIRLCRSCHKRYDNAYRQDATPAI